MFFVFLVIGGSFLWLFPLWLFHAKDARLGNFDQRSWPRGTNLALTVIDLVRAAVGANLLARGLLGLPIPRGGPEWLGEVWVAAALALALAVQTLSWRDEDYVRAPVAFLLGALLVLIHPLVMAIGLLLAVGTALAVRAWSAGFIGAGVGLIGVGLVFEAQDLRRALMLGVAVNIPVIVSLLAGRHLGEPRK
jgi:hypothetical protein